MPFRLSSIAGAGKTALAGSEHGIAFSLDRLDLLQQQFEPIEFPTDLRLQIGGQQTAVAGPERLQLLAPVATQRLVAGYALAEQKPFDAVDVSHALIRQDLALARETTAVFFLWCWHWSIAHTPAVRPACMSIRIEFQPPFRVEA